MHAKSSRPLLTARPWPSLSSTSRSCLPGVSETASLAGPYDVIVRAQARDIDELAKLVALRVQALDGVTRSMSCPVVHL